MKECQFFVVASVTLHPCLDRSSCTIASSRSAMPLHAEGFDSQKAAVELHLLFTDLFNPAEAAKHGALKRGLALCCQLIHPRVNFLILG